ncbi:MAG: 6-carboxytetrahydropterin synthase [Lachnospiraceae bacterium]|nr:6-carboxytetrahydropterin synthase [Lachnospiraceae bacterium]
MANKIFREYRFKFYLNAQHFVLINGKKGSTHPHTWEFTLDILINRNIFVEFGEFEKKIEEYLERYQDKLLNDVAPFDVVIPTLENMSDIFAKDFSEEIREMGARLVRLEGKETPTRGYIVDFTETDEYMNDIKDFSHDAVIDIIDSVIDSTL